MCCYHSILNKSKSISKMINITPIIGTYKGIAIIHQDIDIIPVSLRIANRTHIMNRYCPILLILPTNYK